MINTSSSSPTIQINHEYKTTSTSSESKIKLVLNNWYALRKHLQKMEFVVCWIIIFLMTATNMSPTISIAYLKLSAFNRFLAYVADFTNAYYKLDGSIPKWLILHHSGALVGHITLLFFLTPSSQYQVFLIVLGFQASHNTWTKKLSLVLYWGNVIVGTLAWCSYHVYFLHINNSAGKVMYMCLFTTILGICLLVRDSIISKSKRVA